MKTNLIWFRNDLRTYDNTALNAACTSYKDQVIALFIFTPQQWSFHDMSISKISFIYQNVMFLKKSLRNLNIHLYCYQSTNFTASIEYLIYFCKKHQINNMFYNYQYEFNERTRDVLVKKQLSEKGILVTGFHDSILVSANKIYTQSRKTYKKFFPFKKKIIQILSHKIPQCFTKPVKRTLHAVVDDRPVLSLYNQIHFNTHLFPIGELQAQHRLKQFCKKKINDYFHKRNFPAWKNTSMLSPYLSMGILSVRNCFLQVLDTYKNTFNTAVESPWINEIIWREFYYHLLIGYPVLSQNKSLNRWEKNLNWNNNAEHFFAWTQGNTGFPIVDAGMRQLKKIGWMHNRLRMITASFLVKNLCINWRKGEKYFMSQLIDGDMALNNGGWQWVASIGSDSVPYMRIFNPTRQSKIYDKLGVFIREFIPELNDVPNIYIHQPHEWAKINNIYLNYPKPIIDYQYTKEKSLLMFFKAKSSIKP